MAKKTLQERYVEALIKLGEKEVKRTARYIVFSKLSGGFYYLGSSGALRHGHNRANSIPVSQSYKEELIG